MAMKEFIVVEFPEEGTVDVVHRSWLEQETDESGFQVCYTYWPPRDAPRLAKEGSPPKKTHWTRYLVRILGSTDNFLSAREKADDAQYTSNLDTADEGCRMQPGRPIRKKRPRRVSSSDEDVPRAPRTPSSRTAAFPAAPAAPVMTENARSLLPSVSTSSATNQDNTVLERHLLRALSDLTLRMEEIRKDTYDMKNTLACLVKDKSKTEGREIPGDLGLPLQTPQDVEELEGKLTEVNEEALVRGLSAIGGTNMPNMVRRIMSKIMADRCARHYNWKGNNPQKIPFSKLRLCSVVLRSVKTNSGTSNSSDREIENTMKHWLRFAAERDGGRQLREERKKREALESGADRSST